MSLFCCSCNAQIISAQIISAQVTVSWNTVLHFPSSRSLAPFKSLNTGLLSQRGTHIGSKLGTQWSFVGGSRIVIQPEVARISCHRKGSSVSACWLTTSQIATNAFTLGTVAVLPFYTLMIVAPNAQLTKRTMESNVPCVALGILYAYLLYLSWSPETLRLMFASKYLLPELPGITRMFSNETTVSSAWIHLLAVDLFAARFCFSLTHFLLNNRRHSLYSSSPPRLFFSFLFFQFRQVFHDGIENKIETRHSISLCLLFCPIGIATHAITKQLTRAKDG